MHDRSFHGFGGREKLVKYTPYHPMLQNSNSRKMSFLNLLINSCPLGIATDLDVSQLIWIVRALELKPWMFTRQS